MSLYLALRTPGYYRMLQREVDDAFDEGLDITSGKDMSRLTILNNTINEALRLFPPVPAGLLRVAPAGGSVIAGEFVAGGTVVRSVDEFYFLTVELILSQCPDLCYSARSSILD